MENFGEIFLIFGITGSVLMGAVAYLIKSLTNHFLSKDVEVFKSNLKIESDKSKLQYEILQEKRARIIEDLYKKLVDFEEAGKHLMAPMQPIGVPDEIERRRRAGEKYVNFCAYYNQHRIYLNTVTCVMVEKILDVFWSAWNDFQFRKELSTREDDLWTKSWKVISEEIPNIRRELESVFRDIIGVK